MEGEQETAEREQGAHRERARLKARSFHLGSHPADGALIIAAQLFAKMKSLESSEINLR